MQRHHFLLVAVLASCNALAKDVVAQPADSRPLALVADMTAGPLQAQLAACMDDPVRRTPFSIGHRGAPYRYPEHTRESYVAAAAMGAGLVECDVTFTRDLQLVCRHAQDDLHTTTDILLTPLAARCTRPFEPARFDDRGGLLAAATAECRTSDLTLAEFRTLRGKHDGFDPRARSAAEYVRGGRTAANAASVETGSLLTHAESIALFRELGVRMVPELKQPVVPMPFAGLSQQAYAQRMLDEYKAAGVSPADVWPQSFNLADVEYWIEHDPDFGRQAVYLDDANGVGDLPDAAGFAKLHAKGVRYWAPPLFALLALDERGDIVPSRAALDARAAGLEIVAWTLERSGPLGRGSHGFYYQTIDSALRRDSDVFQVLDVLARKVRVRAVFSDWPATVTYYANCMGLN